MSADRFARLREIVLRAIDLPDAERPAFLDEACAGDPELRSKADGMLRQHEKDSGILKTGGAADVLGITSATMHARSTAAGPPQAIHPYRIIRVLGTGAMGIVYLAEQTEPIQRQVALKVIKPGMDTKEVVSRFESERQALARMDHPNVAKVLAAGATPEGRPYFVMDYVPGAPITEYCERHALTIRERLELCIQVCRGIHHAHQRDVIHRDIKPSNVLVTEVDERPIPKVIDFGIAKAMSGALTDKTIHTMLGQLVGTPAYMSPEQAEGRLDIDARTDVYSLGAMLYQLVAGRPPFDVQELHQSGMSEIPRIIREREPGKPSKVADRECRKDAGVAKRRGVDSKTLVRELQGDLDWVVLKAIAKEPARRYQTARELAEDLERLLDRRPVRAHRPDAAYRARKLVERHPRRLAVSTMAVCCCPWPAC